MKFYTNQLSQLIQQIASGKIKALLLYGVNRGFISTSIDQIVKKLNLFTININEKGATYSNLNLLANSKNFFKQRELIKVEYNSSGITNDLKQLLSNNNFNNLISFIGGDSLPSSGIRKFFEDTPALAIMPCYYDDENTVARIANAIAAKNHKTISPQGLLYIKEKLKGDHELIKSELDKLMSYTQNKSQISYEDVFACISGDLSASGDEMCIFFSKQQPKLFLKEIEKLKNQNINEILIIRALIRYYINLYIVITKIEEGQNIELAIKALTPPIFFKYILDFKQVVNKISSNDAFKIIELLQNAELNFKKNNQSFDFFEEIYMQAYNL